LNYNRPLFNFRAEFRSSSGNIYCWTLTAESHSQARSRVYPLVGKYVGFLPGVVDAGEERLEEVVRLFPLAGTIG
jgi:hypothetical protein